MTGAAVVAGVALMVGGVVFVAARALSPSVRAAGLVGMLFGAAAVTVIIWDALRTGGRPGGRRSHDRFRLRDHVALICSTSLIVAALAVSEAARRG